MNSQQSVTKRISLRGLQFLLVVIGLFIAGYLSYLKLAAAPAVCVESGPFNCNVVLNSQYSELSGIPIAYLGFGVYALIGLVLLFERQQPFLAQYGSLIVFGIALFAWLFSMWLVVCAVLPVGSALPLVPQPRGQFHPALSSPSPTASTATPLRLRAKPSNKKGARARSPRIGSRL